MKIRVLIILLFLLNFGVAKAQRNNNSLMKVDYESLVSKADLTYDVPVLRSEEGMPVGNGRMGSLVWTTPEALHFQINRVDVFAMDCNTNSFPDGDTNYSFGCGYVDINMVDYGHEAFTGRSFSQHLSVYEGLSTVKGDGITARVLAWSDKDVIATEIEDQRDNPSVINIDLRMLRYAKNYTDVRVMESKYGISGMQNAWELTSNHAVQIVSGLHMATSRLDIRDGRIILIQEFREGEFYCASAIAIGIAGRRSKAYYYNEATVRLSAEPGKGTFTVLTSSASSFDSKEDVAGLALKQLDAAQTNSFNDLVQDNRDWWGNFWSKGFINLHSNDGEADFVAKNYTYFLYIMASCSRGDYMPGFRSMLWNTTGDMAAWGSQYWWNNQGFYFDGLTPSNRPELLEPVFSMFSKHYESYARAARQQWGSKGLWIPETTWWNGLEDLPDNIAKEMRDLYLVRKPWEEASREFHDFAKNKNEANSRWNWRSLGTDLGERYNWKKGPFSWVSHIFATTAKIAYVYWLNYAYYLDKEWLKTTGYPMIKGVAEFYRNFPNLYKAADGKYHIRYVNNHESNWGSNDTPEELLAMHAMIPIAIHASEILGVDAELRPLWQEIVDNLTPVPSSLEPVQFYDFCNTGTSNKEIFNQSLETYNKYIKENSPIGNSVDMNIEYYSRLPIAAANLGMANDLKYFIPSQMRSHKWKDHSGVGESGVRILRNRLSLMEGPGAIECERLGVASHALQLALLQSVPPSPGENPINYIFPAWPKEWDAQFTLAARDAFLISAAMEKGEIEFVEIYSRKGGKCYVQNPWPGTEIILYRDGKRLKNISGKLLVLSAEIGETLTIAPKGKTVKPKEIL